LLFPLNMILNTYLVYSLNIHTKTRQPYIKN
jgi:hypothetical protein